jgi:hypothetical protein
LEQLLHLYIQNALLNTYGSDRWRNGVPENICAECAATRERDPEPAAEPYCYTTLIHLKKIIDRRWSLFSKLVAKGPSSNNGIPERAYKDEANSKPGHARGKRYPAG